jgi:transposase-like protein
LAAYLILTTKKGISIEDLARKVEVTQTTAYFLQQQLACTVQRRYGRALFGLVEADESYVGPSGTTRGRGTEKDQILVLVEDKSTSAGEAHIVHVSDEALETLQPEIEGRVEPGSTIKTDGLRTYVTLEEIGFDHEQLVSANAEADDAAVENLPWGAERDLSIGLRAANGL